MRYAKKNRKQHEYKDLLEGELHTIHVRFVESSKSERFKRTRNADETLMAKTYMYGDFEPDVIEIYIDNIANYVFKDYKRLNKDFKRSAHLVTLMYGVLHEILHEFEGLAPGLQLIFEGEVKI